tara:strand:+ start:12 stop:815 length:804 start_codon:yes stop_codon:yes gene_type:complete
MLQGEFFQNPGSASGFYTHQIQQSVRIDDGSSSYLSRTNSGTATNEDVGLLSFWFKRGNNLGSTTNECIAGGSSQPHRIEFNTNAPSGYSDALVFTFNGGGSYGTTNQRFRDPSAWTNFILEYNSDDGTNDNRIKIYINGVKLDAMSDSSSWVMNGTNYESSGRDFAFTDDGSTVNFGRSPNNSGSYYDGLIAEVICVDGSASYTDVGEFSQGFWIPKEYTGSFGNNGYHLKFENASNLGLDSSGNNNNFVANNMGADHQTLDTITF